VAFDDFRTDKERRLTLGDKVKADPNAKLKNLAGLIQGLTYSEMKDFSGQLTTKINDGTKELPDILLEVAADILKK